MRWTTGMRGKAGHDPGLVLADSPEVRRFEFCSYPGRPRISL